MLDLTGERRSHVLGQVALQVGGNRDLALYLTGLENDGAHLLHALFLFRNRGLFAAAAHKRQRGKNVKKILFHIIDI